MDTYIYKAITPRRNKEIQDVTWQFIHSIPEPEPWTGDYVEYLKLTEEDVTFIKLTLGDKITLIKIGSKL